MARPIDHLVLPVDSLRTARERYGRMGFAVREDRRHPFGTANCCVYFENDTYLEPLAVADREMAEAAMVQGNVFVRRQDAYRFRHGEGFAMLALASDNADADQAIFTRHGYGEGQVYAFERKSGADGQEKTIGVRLALAIDWRAPDAMIFTCQHLDRQTLRDSGPCRHDNGVVGISGVYMAEANPADFQYYLEATTGVREIRSTSLGIEAEVGGGKTAILTPDGFAALFGKAVHLAERGLRLCGATLMMENPEKLAEKLADSSIEYSWKGERLVVDRAPGQGLLLAFEPAS